MKKKTTFIMSLMLLLLSLFSVGCGSRTENWAYIHDPKATVLSLSGNGKAVYKGISYDYTRDDACITLTDKDGNELELKYISDGDAMTLYEKSTYTYEGEGSPDGIVGVWKQDNGWLYRFTDNGEFSEEDIFSGHYTVDESNSSIKLMYDEPIEDAVLYYELNGSELTIDYPWPMVRTVEE